MRLGELIKILQEAKEKHGDLEVVTWEQNFGVHAVIHNARFKTKRVFDPEKGPVFARQSVIEIL